MKKKKLKKKRKKNDNFTQTTFTQTSLLFSVPLFTPILRAQNEGKQIRNELLFWRIHWRRGVKADSRPLSASFAFCANNFKKGTRKIGPRIHWHTYTRIYVEERSEKESGEKRERESQLRESTRITLPKPALWSYFLLVTEKRNFESRVFLR